MDGLQFEHRLSLIHIYSMTNLRSGALSRRTNGEEYPKYTPDFIKLAESYGAKGIRVTQREEIAAAFEEARKSTKAVSYTHLAGD